MGLDELKTFKPDEKIIEYILRDESEKRLIDLTCKEYANITASESPTPGGGSASAYIGALGAALGAMVANLSAHKAGWDDRWEEFSNWAEKGQKIKNELLFLVDEDTRSYNLIIEAFKLPKGTPEEIAERKKAIQDATRYAIEIPFKVMQKAFESMEVIKAMTEHGNPSSVSDAGVGALCARTAVMGAFMNVKINASGLEDKDFINEIIAKGAVIEKEAKDLEAQILEIVFEKVK